MPEALARQAPHPLKTVVTVLSGAVCIPGRCTPARRCLAPGTRAATLTAFHAHVTPFPALGEHCCWDRDVHRNLTDAPPPTTVLPPPSPSPDLPHNVCEHWQASLLQSCTALVLCASRVDVRHGHVCVRAARRVVPYGICPCVLLCRLAAMKKIRRLSPLQRNTPKRMAIIVLLSVLPSKTVPIPWWQVCVCVSACVRARSLRFSPNDTAPIVRGVCAAGAHGLRKACIAARARLGIQARSAHADGHAHRQGRCCGQYPVLFRSMMEGKLALR